MVVLRDDTVTAFCAGEWVVPPDGDFPELELPHAAARVSAASARADFALIFGYTGRLACWFGVWFRRPHWGSTTHMTDGPPTVRPDVVRPIEAGRLFRDLLPVPPDGPLPILTLYGSSRARNRAVLDQLAEACRGAEPHPLPHVRLHVDGRGQGWTRRDALAELVYRFSRISHP